MANNNLIKKKSIALTEATHARLMEVVGFLQTKRGVNTTANQALEVLLEGWAALMCQAESTKSQFGEPLIDSAVTDFISDNISK